MGMIAKNGLVLPAAKAGCRSSDSGNRKPIFLFPKESELFPLVATVGSRQTSVKYYTLNENIR